MSEVISEKSESRASDTSVREEADEPLLQLDLSDVTAKPETKHEAVSNVPMGSSEVRKESFRAFLEDSESFVNFILCYLDIDLEDTLTITDP